MNTAISLVANLLDRVRYCNRITHQFQAIGNFMSATIPETIGQIEVIAEYHCDDKLLRI
jgi:hypothetical protein